MCPLPHYLSRDFAAAIPQAGLQEMLGWEYTPAKVAEVTVLTNYQDFWTALESKPHNIVHGLHHANVDRIWWQWQQQDPQTRTLAYQGKRNDGADASLDDVMPMVGLAADRVVREITWTRRVVRFAILIRTF